MNHKHVQVILEEHDYMGEYDTQDVINDLIDYIESVERGESDKHYERCIGKVAS